VEHQFAARRGGVDRLLQAAEPDAAVGQGGDGVDQVAQRPAKSVQLPHHQSVTRAQLIQDLVQRRSGGHRPAGGIDKHPVAAGRLQRIDLQVGVLLAGRDAGVAEVGHAPSVA
jgi:hypothetical protein